MPTQYTSPYNLPYPQASDPVRDGQVNMELLAKAINTILSNGSFPAATPDVAALTAAVQNRRMEYTVSGGSATASVTAGIGNLVPVTYYGASAGAAFADRVGANSGEIIIREEGFYRVHIFIAPISSPGLGWLKLQTTRNNLGRDEAQSGNTTAMWETTVSAPVAIYMKPGDKVRGTYSTASTHTYNATLSIEKVGTLTSWGTPSS